MPSDFSLSFRNNIIREYKDKKWGGFDKKVAEFELGLKGVARISTVKLKRDKKQAFLEFYDTKMAEAYQDRGFKGSELLINLEDLTIQSTTYWRTIGCIERNNRHPKYKATMTKLAEFIEGTPKTQTVHIAGHLPGYGEVSPGNEPAQSSTERLGTDNIAEKRAKLKAASPSPFQAGGGIDYSR